MVLWALVCLGVAGCNLRENLEDDVKMAPVTVEVSACDVGGTRTVKSVANYDGVQALTVAFYDGEGAEVYKTTQMKSEATTFGSVSCELPVGSYTMVAVVYNSDEAITLTSQTEAAYTADKCRETFAGTKAVTVTSAGAQVNMTLDRIVSVLCIVSTDYPSATAKNCTIHMSKGGKAFNPATGLATADTGVDNVIPVSTETTKCQTFKNYLFLTSDEETIDVSFDVTDENDQVLVHREIMGVTCKRNRATVLSGKVFTPASSGVVNLNTDWLTDQNVNF